MFLAGQIGNIENRWYNCSMTENDKLPKPKRRWLRFNLRTLLIVLTVFCVWLGWYLLRVEQQRDAVRWVAEDGGTVRYDYDFDLDDESIDDGKPSVPKWLLDMLGVDYFSTVTFVGISMELSDVTPLATLKSLRFLYLSNTQVSDVTPLTGLTNLEQLLLGKTQVTDVTPLAGLTNLEYLDLSDTQVSDVTALAGLSNLKYLWLKETLVSDVTPLAGLTNLEQLVLRGTQVSDVTPLAGLTNLKYLYLSNTQISDVTPLTGLTNLEQLLLDGTQVSDEDYERLKQALPSCMVRRQ